MDKKIAIVTGSNRGLGLASAERLAELGYQVVFACREPAKIESRLRELSQKAFYVASEALDVSDQQSRSEFCERFAKKWNRLDVLVNNAGIFGDRGHPESDVDLVRKTLETNTLGPYDLCDKLIPLMVKNHYGRVVNVSSGMGQLSEMATGYAAYRISKTALNAVTKVFAEAHKKSGILVNSICPGWVKTDMGGESAPRTIAQGIDTIIWAATLDSDGPSGGFFRDRKPIAW